MRTRRQLGVACAAAALAVAGAQRSQAAAVHPCPLFAAAVRTDGYWSLHLTKHSFVSTGGGAWRCELASPPPPGSVSPEFTALVVFFTSPTPAVAHQNVASLLRKGAALQVTGADEAFATELHQRGSTSTRVTWRRNRYWGWLAKVRRWAAWKPWMRPSRKDPFTVPAGAATLTSIDWPL